MNKMIAYANKLDSQGLHLEADLVDRIVLSYQLAPRKTEIPSADERSWRLYHEMTQQANPQRMYDIFKKSYEENTGSAWGPEEFARKSRKWIYFGDENGFISLRPQESGLWKLVGAAGNMKSIIKAFRQLNAMPYPVWGVVTPEIKDIAKKASGGNFTSAPEVVVRILAQKIPTGTLGGEINEIGQDGSLNITYQSAGDTVKFMVGNKNYWQWVLEKVIHTSENNQISEWADSISQEKPLDEPPQEGL